MKNQQTQGDDAMFRTIKGPFAVVRACNFCDYKVVLKTGQRGVGCGFGFREGNKARGKMIQHYNKIHKTTMEVKGNDRT